LLDAAGYEVTSVDLHPEHFVAAGLACLSADLNRPLEFATGSFQAVLAVEVIEHLENPWGFLREAIRVLHSDGVLVVTSPNVMSWQARLSYLRTGILPYFRPESFEGCYHVTPIFAWGIERCISTTSARLEATSYSRNDWPRANDVPHFDDGKGWRRWLLDWLPQDQRFGEIAVYRIRKSSEAPSMEVGRHYA
jgi:SAM-dependent methyltransferase